MCCFMCVLFVQVSHSQRIVIKNKSIAAVSFQAHALLRPGFHADDAPAVCGFLSVSVALACTCKTCVLQNMPQRLCVPGVGNLHNVFPRLSVAGSVGVHMTCCVAPDAGQGSQGASRTGSCIPEAHRQRPQGTSSSSSQSGWTWQGIQAASQGQEVCGALPVSSCMLAMWLT